MKKILHILIVSIVWPQITSAQGPIKQFSLDSCINYAFKNSPYLQAGQKNIAIAERNVDIIKSAYYPSVNITANAQVTEMYESMDEYSNSSVSFDISQPVWQNGKIRLQTKIAETNRNILQEGYFLEKQNLVYRISQQYFDFLRYSELEKLSGEMVSRLAINTESAKERLILGVAKKSDVLRSETRLSDARIEQTRYKSFKETTEQNLKQLMGYTPSVYFLLADTFLIETNIITMPVDSFVDHATDNLPEYKMAEFKHLAQKYSVNLEQRKGLPDIGLFAGYNLNNNPVLNNEQYGYAGVSVNFNIFNGFEKKNRNAREKIRLEQISYELDDLQLLIISEIKQSYILLTETGLQIKDALTQLESATENRNMANEEYYLGISSMLELLEAENDFFKAQQNYINSVWEYRQAEITLERKSGIFKY